MEADLERKESAEDQPKLFEELGAVGRSADANIHVATGVENNSINVAVVGHLAHEELNNFAVTARRKLQALRPVVLQLQVVAQPG